MVSILIIIHRQTETHLYTRVELFGVSSMVYCHQWCIVVLSPVVYFGIVTSGVLWFCHQWCIVVLSPVVYCGIVTSGVL